MDTTLENPKSEIRRPESNPTAAAKAMAAKKSEGRKRQRSRTESSVILPSAGPFRISGFGLRSDFGFRISDFLHHLSVPIFLTLIHCSLLLPSISRAAAEAPASITLDDFKLVGDLGTGQAGFTLTANARVEGAKGGSIELLSGPVALTEVGPHPKWQLRAEPNKYIAVFERSGKYPIRIKFDAAVRDHDSWKSIEFHVASALLQPVVLHGLGPDTQFDFPGAARPERKGSDFLSFLPADGSVKLSWKEARPEAEGKLFYSAEMLSQISVAPGLMRQTALLDFKIMQGELNRVTLILRGAGEVTRVQGEQVLAWSVERRGPDQGPLTSAATESGERRLVIQFNQPQKERFELQIQMQTPLGAFPQTADAMQLRPDGATRFAGYFRIVNDGAVRLEVAQASGLSQISPEQFPDSDVTRTALRLTGSQRFAYRFSSADFALRMAADQILPELGVSEVLAYHLGETELAIDAEIELDIREAPLRELLLRVPAGYVIAQITASGMSDYFLNDATRTNDLSQADLKLVYGQPVSGRQLVQLRLERNESRSGASSAPPSWSLPRVEVVQAKSVRGHVGVAADPGFRLTPGRTQSLTELATAFFPRKVTGLQAAFRLSDPAWQATVQVERLPQTVQADVLHLFSIAEGVVYGSSLINYSISGAPVSSFRVALPADFGNAEFTGKDVRTWQVIGSAAGEGNGSEYVVQLHTPVSGPYTLLATYERTFKPHGETLSFTGARPLEVQAEQGHTLLVSAYQFQMKPAEVSGGLLALQPGEVPAEYRLFFDAPILAAYRYSSRPFNLKLAVSPLAQGDSLAQVVDRASITNHISKEGQVLTDVRYFLKNRGSPNFRITLPKDTQLWSAWVNGAPVVPVMDGRDNLVPLPQQSDPNAVLTVDLKLAGRSNIPERVSLAAPSLLTPMMLLEWRAEPDAGQRLVYRSGSLSPAGGVADISGFAQLARTFSGAGAGTAWTLLGAGLALIGAAAAVWNWSCSSRRKEALIKTGKPGAKEDLSLLTSAATGRRILGGVAGAIALGVGLLVLYNVLGMAGEQRQDLPPGLTFLAPVQQHGHDLQIEIGNLPERASVGEFAGYLWPALLAAVVVLAGLRRTRSRPGASQRLAWMFGGTLLGWAVLRCPNGGVVFLVGLFVLFLAQLVVPAFWRLWRHPLQPQPSAPPLAAAGLSSASTALLIGCSLLLTFARPSSCRAGTQEPEHATRNTQHALRNTSLPPRLSPLAPLPASVLHEVRIEDKFALGAAMIHWEAEKGQALPLLFGPAVLTRLTYASNALDLVAAAPGSKAAQELVAKRSGVFDITVQYELPVTKKDSESGLVLPVSYGLVNRLKLTVANLDVDVQSPQAVSVQREYSTSNTLARVVLPPVADVWIGWKPRSRDVHNEKAVFYAEVAQLYVPAAGVIEGAHNVSIRPAQGELAELVLEVPAGASVTDVSDRSDRSDRSDAKSLVSLWRFDPDTRKLRVTFSSPQSRPFALLVRSQLPAGPLPFEQSVGLLSVTGAAGQIGLLGIATGNEVQLESVNAPAFSPINLEDFPPQIAATVQGQTPGLMVRRAFRYTLSEAGAAADRTSGDRLSPPQMSGLVCSLKASAVEPDIRVESQNTLSLSEDRSVLAANLTVTVTRAGIFRLSFVMPDGFDVEAISGPSLSHWTESRNEADSAATNRGVVSPALQPRVITLHLQSKTLGQQQFAVSLAGPGVRSARNWPVPQLTLREATKQRGTLLVVPEQGMRLQATQREGVTQLDPQKSGIRQKGVLAFGLLQTPWKLALDLEQVEPWVQVAILQHATVSEAQIKVVANLQYQIENTGLKLLRLFMPTNAEGVRFQGELVADTVPVAGTVTNGLQEWDVKLQRRIIGPYFLQATYQTSLPDRATNGLLRGIQAAGVNLQRGFVTVQAAGRLQVRADSPPAALQPAEWQSIPRSLQQTLAAQAANFTWRLAEDTFTLPLKVERHEAARLLPARINNVTFTSVVSDDGVVLTHARIEMIPGDLRLLNLRLPHGAEFWFGFVNQAGIWPWRDQDVIKLPIEAPSREGRPALVEFFFSRRAGQSGSRSLDLQLLAPKFDLPLENVSWNVSLSDKWKLGHWSGSMQFQNEQAQANTAAVDLQRYLQTEASLRQARTKEAEGFLAWGNSALESGDPAQARRSFQAAYGLSTQDPAFNEDARVQLHNIKLQQALVGLNVRQNALAGDAASLGPKFRDLHNRKELNYTQQDAKDIIERNSADDNAAYMRLAERLIQQQDAAVTTPAAIRANLPEQGRLLTFKRAVVVDALMGKQEDLKLDLRLTAAKATSSTVRLLILAATLVVLGVFVRAGRLGANGA